MNDRTERLRNCLNTALEPNHLEIIDESEKHKGHAAAQQGLGHYAVIIDSPHFKGKNLLACHRMVYRACQSMMNTDIHALSIQIRRDMNNETV